MRDGAGGALTGQATYTYDALDRRIATTLDSDGVGEAEAVTTWTAYDGWNPYADFDGAGALRVRYLHAGAVDALLARTDAATGVSEWYLGDRLGTVRDIVDAEGLSAYHAEYDAFGRKAGESGAGGDRFGFTGRETDAVSGLQHNRWRY